MEGRRYAAQRSLSRIRLHWRTDPAARVVNKACPQPPVLRLWNGDQAQPQLKVGHGRLSRHEIEASDWAAHVPEWTGEGNSVRRVVDHLPIVASVRRLVK